MICNQSIALSQLNVPASACAVVCTCRAVGEWDKQSLQETCPKRKKAASEILILPLPGRYPSGSSHGEPYAVLPKLCYICCCSAQYIQLS